MDAGFSTVNVPDQQTVNPSWIQAGNWDSTGVSMQPENLQPLQDTGFYLTEPFGDTVFTAFDLGATGFTYDEGAPVSTYPNTVDPEGYGDVELSHDTMIEQAKSNDFERDGNNFRCNICGTTTTRQDNLRRHQRTAKKCKTAWERQGKAALGGSRTWPCQERLIGWDEEGCW
ncbi:hypothetical protein BKA56DRAFT_237029 [Ilyonectria sp. MPI-CAGE-AT-0026]|nr:hypothetical protein BKA56DRAFT_237029 [Ilyonectria sp. MPI-CAGE-AT-0026]